jgi:hypothetical protein
MNHMKTLLLICLALIASASAWAQQAVGNSRVNTDFSKYKTFTWAKQDLTTVDNDGYDIYYYELDPNNNRKMNRENREERREQKRDQKIEKKTEKRAERDATTYDEPYYYSYSVIIPAKDETINSVIKEAISNELEGRGYTENEPTGDLIIAYQVLDHKAQLHGYTNDDPVTASGQQVHTPQDTATFALDPGSLIITLIDAKTSQMVWDGFAKGMYYNNQFVNDEVKIKEAVHDIFTKFKYSADKARR